MMGTLASAGRDDTASRSVQARAPGLRLAYPAPRLAEEPAPLHSLGAMPPSPAVSGNITSPIRATYLRLLTWAFTFFNSVRILSYLPTVWTLSHSSDSSQHSLWTWGTWFFANVTMSLWLIERNGSRLDRVAAVNICNAVMCLAVIVLIVVARF